jgi:AmiR/NasT family two-component response regulator
MTGILFSPDLFFSSRILAEAQRAGLEVRAVPDLAMLREQVARHEVRLVLVDLGATQTDPAEIVAAVAAQQPRPCLIAFGPHVHAERLQAARAAGCDLVLTRGQFDGQVADLLRRFLEPRGPAACASPAG